MLSRVPAISFVVLLEFGGGDCRIIALMLCAAALSITFTYFVLFIYISYLRLPISFTVTLSSVQLKHINYINIIVQLGQLK